MTQTGSGARNAGGVGMRNVNTRHVLYTVHLRKLQPRAVVNDRCYGPPAVSTDQLLDITL